MIAESPSLDAVDDLDLGLAQLGVAGLALIARSLAT